MFEKAPKARFLLSHLHFAGGWRCLAGFLFRAHCCGDICCWLLLLFAWFFRGRHRIPKADAVDAFEIGRFLGQVVVVFEGPVVVVVEGTVRSGHRHHALVLVAVELRRSSVHVPLDHIVGHAHLLHQPFSILDFGVGFLDRKQLDAGRGWLLCERNSRRSPSEGLRLWDLDFVAVHQVGLLGRVFDTAKACLQVNDGVGRRGYLLR